MAQFTLMGIIIIEKNPFVGIMEKCHFDKLKSPLGLFTKNINEILENFLVNYPCLNYQTIIIIIGGSVISYTKVKS